MYKVIIFALITTFISACNQTSNEGFVVNDAWVREAPPNASMLAGYATIKNNTDQEHIITFAKSEKFNMVEVHQTIIENGVSKMRRQKNLAIPAGSTLEMKPGSYHLMLMGPKSSLKSGDEITVTVGLKSGDDLQELEIVMPVKKP